MNYDFKTRFYVAIQSIMQLKTLKLSQIFLKKPINHVFTVIYIMKSRFENIDFFSVDTALKKAKIADAESSETYSDDFVLENSMDQDDKTFFHAKDPKKGWVRYSIDKAKVRLVKLQNRPDCCCKFCSIVYQKLEFFIFELKLTLEILMNKKPILIK